MRPAPQGFCLRLLVGALSRVYLPVDRGGALIGGARFCAPFRSHSPPQAKVHCAESNSSFDSNYK